MKLFNPPRRYPLWGSEMTRTQTQIGGDLGMASVREVLANAIRNRIELQRAISFCYRVKRYYGVDPVKVAKAIIDAKKQCLANMSSVYTCIGMAEVDGVVIVDIVGYTNSCNKWHGVFKYEKLVAVRKEDLHMWREQPEQVKTVWTTLWCG